MKQTQRECVWERKNEEELLEGNREKIGKKMVQQSNKPTTKIKANESK